MYKVIGADQREYGPVDAEQVRRWVAEGRANGATLVQADGSPAWVTLSSLPEFTDLFPPSSTGASGSTPPPLGTSGAPTDPNELAEYYRNRGSRVDLNASVNRSWELFKKNAPLLIGATLLFFALTVGLSQLIGLLTKPVWQSMSQGDVNPVGIVVLFLANIPEVALSTVLTAGFYVILLKLIRTGTAGIGDLFAGFGAISGQLVLAGIVVQMLCVLGAMACLIPGIYLSVAWIYAVPLVWDRQMDFWTAMELSRKVVTKQWWMVFCLVIVVALMNFLGVLACCVGALVASPVGLGALMYAYEDIFGSTGTTPY